MENAKRTKGGDQRERRRARDSCLEWPHRRSVHLAETAVAQQLNDLVAPAQLLSRFKHRSATLRQFRAPYPTSGHMDHHPLDDLPQAAP